MEISLTYFAIEMNLLNNSSVIGWTQVPLASDSTLPPPPTMSMISFMIGTNKG